MGTILAFHAHPDDEALLTAGTLARAVSEGHQVILVLATRGDAGDVGAEVLRQDEDLAARRSQEAQASANAIGVKELRFLDYADSGLTPDATGSWPDGSFCAATVGEIASHVIALLREFDADLLIADDRNGGYGHPDHQQVHRVAYEASLATGIPFLQATIDREFLSGGIELAKSLGLEVPEGFVPPDLSSWYSPHDEITHVVDVSSALGVRRASMAAHTTQTTGAPDSVRTLALFLGLPEDIFAIAFSTEWYVMSSTQNNPELLPDLFSNIFTVAP